ncbi:MAG TPA: hypothetical protein VN368_00045 [Candidatus Methylomirabilis sp.]|nr:hypothetical protein [Candidatus Methylomirabilis sp.]
MKKILFVVLLLPLLYTMLDPTFSFFSDKELIRDNTLTSGVWSEELNQIATDMGNSTGNNTSGTGLNAQSNQTAISTGNSTSDALYADASSNSTATP